jgi:hypothetical protein
LATRAELVAEKDYYLMPLPRSGDNAKQIEAWIDEAALGRQPLQNLTRLNERGKKVVFAWAYERERPQSSTVADQEVAWTERVQVVRSLELAKRQAQQLDEHGIVPKQLESFVLICYDFKEVIMELLVLCKDARQWSGLLQANSIDSEL